MNEIIFKIKWNDTEKFKDIPEKDIKSQIICELLRRWSGCSWEIEDIKIISRINITDQVKKMIDGE